MATYQCVVNKAHLKKDWNDTSPAPWCCNKAMVRAQTTQTAAPTKTASATPSAAPTTPQTPKK